MGMKASTIINLLLYVVGCVALLLVAAHTLAGV